MNRFFQFVGAGTVAIGLTYGILYMYSNSDFFKEFLQVAGLLSLLLFVVYLIARIIWGEKWFAKMGLTLIVGADLKKAFEIFFKELPKPTTAVTANLAAHLVYRFTRLSIFAFLLAMIPVVLLWQQNKLLQSQNALFSIQNSKVAEQTGLLEGQNKKIDTQIELDESSRRGNLIVMMSNIMDKVDEELTRDWNNDGKRNLSPQLIGRIAALSYSFRPYRFWRDSSLIEKPLSQERGQLLLALVNSNLDTLTYQSIYKKAAFDQANLEEVDLQQAYLKGVSLRNANLTYADLMITDMRESVLVGADMRKAFFNGADLRGAKLSGGNCNGAHFHGADLSQAEFFGPDFIDIELAKANLTEAVLSGDFTRADLRKANLTGADLSHSIFTYSDFSGANLRKTDLRDLGEENLSRANFEDVKLDGAKISQKDWLKKLKEWGVGFHYQVISNYEVDTINHQEYGGEKYYFIQPVDSED
jgi:uncharacterized protein YjbI with pentapeptide repeats